MAKPNNISILEDGDALFNRRVARRSDSDFFEGFMLIMF